MTISPRSEIDIVEILKNESICIVFQPIISIKKKSVVGLEALCRGINKGLVVPPGQLFDSARKQSLNIELDRLCRRKAIELFSCFRFKDGEVILFINLDASIIDKGVVGSGNLYNMVKEFNVNPGNIVIEINETRVNDVEALKSFIDIHRSYGFIIALDDVGAGHSNLNRLALVKPDILKVDMQLVNNVHTEFYKQEVLKSIVNLSRKIGALVIAEGVESEQDAIVSLDLGVDMLQGYYFSKPAGLNELEFARLTNTKEQISASFKEYILKKVRAEKIRRQEYNRIAKKIADEMSIVKYEDFDEKLREMLNNSSCIECIYILNESGIQISDTVCSICKFPKNERPIFRPAQNGTDHSLKEYYYMLADTGAGEYITDPYISLASGNLCVTISTYFTDAGNNRFIVCIDANFSR